MHTPYQLHRITDEVRVLAAGARGATRSRLVRPTRPLTALRIVGDVRRWGTSPAIGFSLGAARCPDSVAVIDLDDELRPETTFAEIDHRCEVLAVALQDRGIGPGGRVGLLGRNSRSFLESLIAVSRTGADVVYLNTATEANTLEQLVANLRIELLIHDSEFTPRVPKTIPRLLTDEKSGVPLLATIPAKRYLPAQPSYGQHIILTSGTSSGKPRGAGRSGADFDSGAAVLDTFPLTMNSTVLLAAPLFHAWGWMHHRLGTLLDCTQVVMRRPDPERILASLAATDAQMLVTVPVLLRRLVELPTRVKRRYRLDSLRCVAVSGSALPGSLATEFMDDFGDVLYNLYGSTEAAFATCATPTDLRINPESAGRPLAGVHVEILDRRGRRLGRETDGRVFVGSRATFGGYTDGGDRPRVRGMVFTGDIGRLDMQGRLTIVGRADDVIVTGGENVHPAEVEEVLALHPDVADVAVTGAPDPVYGSVLVAHIVPRDPKTFDTAAVLDWSRSRLGPHHRPRSVIIHESLPRNPTGKVLRRVLAGDPQGHRDPDEEYS